MSKLVGRTLELLAETKDDFLSAIKNIFSIRKMSTLKISDLSIGDWVKVKKECLTIGSIYGNGASYSDEVALRRDGRPFAVVSISDIRPIIITPEILEKNGWSNDGMYAFLRIDEHLHLEYCYHEHRLRKYFCGVDEWQNHAKVTDITFAAHCYNVHQLQHALRLAGVDKEINL